MPTHPVIIAATSTAGSCARPSLCRPRASTLQQRSRSVCTYLRDPSSTPALLAFARLELGDVINQLRDAGHLIDIEYGAVVKVAGLDEESDHT